jgi:hypothetical protein
LGVAFLGICLFLGFLLNKLFFGWIVSAVTRNIQFFGFESQQKVSSSYVVVIGLGGVGSHAASMLLRSGIGKLLLVDFDQVLLSLILPLIMFNFSSFMFFMDFYCLVLSFSNFKGYINCFLFVNLALSYQLFYTYIDEERERE